MFDGIDPDFRPDRPYDDRIAKILDVMRRLEQDGRAIGHWRQKDGDKKKECPGQMLLDAYGVKWRIKLRWLPATWPILVAAKQVTGTTYKTIPQFSDNSSDEIVMAVLAYAVEGLRAGLFGEAPRPQRRFAWLRRAAQEGFVLVAQVGSPP